MFKKSLVAMALSTIAFNTMAASLVTDSGNVDLIGKEFVANEATGVALTATTTTLGAQYSVGDIIKFTVSGATIDVANSVPALTFTDAGTDGTTMTLGLLSNADNVLTYRVTAATGNHAGGTADTLALAGVKLTTASVVAAGDITLTFSAETSTGIAIDSAATNSKKVMKAVNQYLTSFAASTDKLDATVSVASLRTNFGTGVYTDVVAPTFADYTPLTGEGWNAGLALQGGAPTATKFTVNGDFSFLDTNGDGKIATGDKIPAPFSGTVAIASDMQSFTVTGGAAFAKVSSTITAGNAAGDVTIENQSFTVDTETTYTPKTGATAKKTNSLAAGGWDLDGSDDDIALMPFGSEYAQSITVANDGSVEGAITVTLIADGKTYVKTLDAVAAAKSVTNISLEVAAFAEASGITGNAFVNVVANVPQANIFVKGVYYHKASADRVLTK